MNKRLFVRFICALLSVLTLVAIIPMATIMAAAEDVAVGSTQSSVLNEAGVTGNFKLYYSNNTYELYCDQRTGMVAYRNKVTGEMMLTNPKDAFLGEESESGQPTTETKEMRSQIVLTYSGNGGGTLYSYIDAAKKDQINVVSIKNGLRVEYAIGDLSPRILAPERIEKTDFEENILKPLREGLEAEYGKADGAWHYNKFLSYYRLINYTTEKREDKRAALEREYPVLAEKGIDMYILGNDALASDSVKREQLEARIKKYTSYTLEMMDEDYDYLEYERADASPPVFKMALEYVVDDLGLFVTLPANGLRYDESVYRISSLIVLPFMGASEKTNGGYSFVADGSGTLYELDSQTQRPSRVYGDDYALQDESNGGNITIKNHQVMRMPVYGQVEFTYTDKEGNLLTKAQYNALSAEEQALCTESKRGYFAIIEEGDSLASVITSHAVNYRHALIKTEFITRQKDSFRGGWSDYAQRRYVENYKIRYIMLTDDKYSNTVDSYYECSWMGMACAYRDYLDKKDSGFERLTSADVSDSGIPLYIETFGCMDTIEKKLSMPVTVSKALTTFDNIAEMYDYLCGKGVKNVNFKLKGYANGGLYADMPYKLKWESAVGGSNGFEELIEKAKNDGFGIYPDFDFVYTTQADGGSSVSLKKHAARTIFNRYTTKRAYSSTYQSFVSYFQMVMAPATYAHFYEKLSARYGKYEATGISLGSFGSALNSDFDEEKTSLREESKEYIVQGLSYFKDQNYSVMVEAGNAFTWGYVDHILSVPLDSSRYSAEMSAVPFVGVVLHGYKQFASTPLNMEGNLSYAMLKAMESGASVYFILSYANTQLLKEDEVLSQNYSVRYDIWQKQLVAIYQELNAVLGDVQTKLIVKHEVLNLLPGTNTMRVPDQDELLKDIEAMAQSKKEQVEQKIEKEYLAKLEAVRTARSSVLKGTTDISDALIENVSARKTAIFNQLQADSALILALRTAITADTNVAKIEEQIIREYVVKPYVYIKKQLQTAEAAVLSAKAGYDFLTAAENAVTQLVQDEARDALIATVKKYVALLNVMESVGYAYNEIAWADPANNPVLGDWTDIASLKALLKVGNNAPIEISNTDLDAYLAGTLVDLTSGYANIGVEELYKAIKALLGKTEYTDANNAAGKTIDLDALVAREYTPEVITYTAITVAPVEIEAVELDTNKKYKVDNNVVAVTYGNDDGSNYKTLLLNFNDYTIRTTYDGVTYTIAAYDYVVIY